MLMSQGGYGAYGLTFLCESLDVAVERLERMIASAETVGLSEGTPALRVAREVYENETGFWTKHVAALSASQCAGWTKEVQTAVDNLQHAITAATGTQVQPYRPDFDPATDPLQQDPLGLKSTLTPVLWIAGLGAAAWLTSSVLGFVRATRRS